MMRAVLLTMLLIAPACGGDESTPGEYLVVTVNKRPAVSGAATLSVKLSNEGSDRTQTFELGNKQFPVTFSVSTPGRVGDLGIEVTALDSAGLLVGKGSSMTTVDMESASVLVDTADYVINTEFAGNQELANYYFMIGYQLAALADGTWMAVSSADCPTDCHVFGRRFDTTGKPVNSTIAAGNISFPMSSKLTTFFTTPAVAATANTTMAVWNYDDPNVVAPMGYSIDCRTFDANGAALTNQVTVSSDEYPNMLSIAPLSSGNFAVAWEGRVGGVDNIRAAIVGPNCAQTSLLTVSTVAGTIGPQYVHAASSGNAILYAWILDQNVRIRTASLAGTFTSVDTQLVAKTATEHVEHVRVAPLPGGNFAVFVRWSNITGTMGPGRIEMIRTNNVGAAMGTPIVVTTRSGTDFNSSQGFGVSAHSDGSIFVVWHACLMNGDGQGCGVFGRLVSSSGTPIGAEMQLNTTILEDQSGPSVVALPGSPASFVTAWTDRSMQAPDTAGASVRARIVYPGDSGTSQ